MVETFIKFLPNEIVIEIIFLKIICHATLINERYYIQEKKSRLNEIFIMRMFNKLWKEIINNTIKWLTFYLANKKCQKCEWNKMTYNEIYSISSLEKNNLSNKSIEHSKLKIKPNILLFF
jgi:Ni,Fe-hydrogenase I cytochrome b subunit